MKWIQQVLWKIQSRHHSVHRRMDGRTRWNQYIPLQLHWSITRTPVFWGYPTPPYDHPYFWPVHIGSQAHTLDRWTRWNQYTALQLHRAEGIMMTIKDYYVSFMTPWQRNVFCIIGGNPPVTSGFPSYRTCNAELWYLLCCQPEQAVEQTVK